MIRLENLSKTFPGQNEPAVDDLTMEIYAGEIVVLVGPSGCGKTTTMKTIYGAAIPTSGDLTVVGLDIRREERAVKRRIGVIPQENNLDEDLKVRENMLVYGRYFDLPKKIARQRADELLDFVQLTEKRDAPELIVASVSPSGASAKPKGLGASTLTSMPAGVTSRPLGSIAARWPSMIISRVAGNVPAGAWKRVKSEADACCASPAPAGRMGIAASTMTAVSSDAVASRSLSCVCMVDLPRRKKHGFA